MENKKVTVDELLHNLSTRYPDDVELKELVNFTEMAVRVIALVNAFCTELSKPLK